MSDEKLLNNKIRIAGCRMHYGDVYEKLTNPQPDSDTIAKDLNDALLTLKSLCIDYSIEFLIRTDTMRWYTQWRDIFLITSDEGIVAFKLAGGQIFE